MLFAVLSASVFTQVKEIVFLSLILYFFRVSIRSYFNLEGLFFSGKHGTFWGVGSCPQNMKKSF